MFSKEFLQNLASDKVIGDFYPFDTANVDEVENYIKQIVDRLKNNKLINVEADFNYYRSGFASYINIRISKKNNSDSEFETSKNRITKSTKGILLYISNLSPYWYYGGSEWSVTTENNKVVGGFSDYIFPKDINNYNKDQWDQVIEKITYTLNHFRYNLLTEKELEKYLNFDLKIKSNLIDTKPRVYDCFFHWED